MENTLEFHISKRRMLKLILVSLVIVLIGFFCVKSDTLVFEIIGYLNLLLGLSSISIGLYYYLDNRPQLILTDSGIEHRKVTKKSISWNTISKAEICKENNNHFINLSLKENLNLDDYKLIFKKTAKSQLERNILKLNIEQLTVDYSQLNSFLNSKLP